MSRDHEFSDEFLNAFVDDQLEPEEKSRAYAQINDDEDMKRRVCELRTMRDLVRLAYKNPPLPQAGFSDATTSRQLGFNVAAVLMLAFGLLLGWILHKSTSAEHIVSTGSSATLNASVENDTKIAGLSPTNPVRSGHAQGNTTAGAPGAKEGAAGDGQMAKVLIHLSDSSATHAAQTLDEIENLLQYYRSAHQVARVELLVNSDGINLLRRETSPFPERISRMQTEYDNLTFVACQNTLERLKREKGITTQLLPGVVVIDSGVAQIMRRQHQGWAYIQA